MPHDDQLLRQIRNRQLDRSNTFARGSIPGPAGGVEAGPPSLSHPPVSGDRRASIAAEVTPVGPDGGPAGRPLLEVLEPEGGWVQVDQETYLNGRRWRRPLNEMPLQDDDSLMFSYNFAWVGDREAECYTPPNSYQFYAPGEDDDEDPDQG